MSRAPCSALDAAPQNRDRSSAPIFGPRISSAPRRAERRAAQHPGNARDTTPHSRDALSPESCIKKSLAKKRAQGMPGVQPHPQPRVRMKKAHEHSHHRFAETIRHSLRDGFTVSFELSPVIGLSCHRRWPRCEKHRRQLDASVEASRPHDFAVRQTRSRQVARSSVHRIPPHVS